MSRLIAVLDAAPVVLMIGGFTMWVVVLWNRQRLSPQARANVSKGDGLRKWIEGTVIMSLLLLGSGIVVPLWGQVVGWMKKGTWEPEPISRYIGLVHFPNWVGVERVLNSILDLNVSLACVLLLLGIIGLAAKAWPAE